MCGWQERAAGLEAVDGMLAAFGGRIGPNVGDLMGALKVRGSAARMAQLKGSAAAGKHRRRQYELSPTVVDGDMS
jgi:hypothetical protein